MTADRGAGRYNVRSRAFLLAHTVRPCAACARSMRMVAIVLPAGHEWLEEGAWRCTQEPAFLFDIASLESGVQSLLQAQHPQFRPTAGGRAGEDGRWLNHCPACGCAQDDDRLHGEPGGAFLPASAEEAASIELLAEERPVAAVAWGSSDAAVWLGALRWAR